MTCELSGKIRAAVQDYAACAGSESAEVLSVVLAENLSRGRVHKVLARHPELTVEAYVKLVAHHLLAESGLLNGMETGDSDTWLRLSEQLGLRAYLRYRRLGMDRLEAVERAGDATQDTCVALLTGWYPADVPFMAWATRILYNLISRDCMRSSDMLDRGLRIQMEELISSEIAGAAELDTDIEMQQLLDWALAQLASAHQRTVVQLDQAGWSNDRIADHLGCSPQAVFNARHRAHKRLATVLSVRTYKRHGTTF